MTERDTRDDIYNFIKAFIERNGYSPSVREIATGVGVSSTNTVNYHKNWLTDDGLIDYIPGMPRSLRIVEA